MNAGGGQKIARGTAMALVALLFLGNALNYVDRQVLALLKPTLEAEFGWRVNRSARLRASKRRRCICR